MSARRSTRRTAGQSPARLGQGDGFGVVAAHKWASETRKTATTMMPPAPSTPPTQRQPHVDETKPTGPTEPDAAGALAGAAGGSAAWATALKLAVALVAVCAITENVASTAYGKFGLDAAVMTVPPRIGWWLMELPVTVSFIYTFFVVGGPQAGQPIPRFLAAVMCIHYSYRGWIFPYMIRTAPGATSNFSLVPAVGGWVVTVLHGYLNGAWFSTHGTHLRGTKWLKDPRFIAGIAIYVVGLAQIVRHDTIMRELRSTPGPRYRIPHGGTFDEVTCAHYFWELVAWLGFWLMSSGPNGLFILLVSVANLVPRAKATHGWYLDHFGDEYAVLNRTYLVPGVW